MKSGFVAIIGRPSTGKSTLINALCGNKISITSTIPQTTRNKIRGILTEDGRGQAVFIDTPGFHLSEKKFNKELINNIREALEDADLILYVLDVLDEPGEEEEKIANIVRERALPFITIINKIDIEKNKLKEILNFLKKFNLEKNLIQISAKKLTFLEELKDLIFKNLKEGPLFYPEEFVTDQEPAFRIQELIREQVIKRVKQEIPYSIYVEIDDLEEREKLLWIKATIFVERESQKGIIVGKAGKGIKKIRIEAQEEIKRAFSKKNNLFLQVKLKQKWNKNSKILKKILKS